MFTSRKSLQHRVRSQVLPKWLQLRVIMHFCAVDLMCNEQNSVAAYKNRAAKQNAKLHTRRHLFFPDICCRSNFNTFNTGLIRIWFLYRAGEYILNLSFRPKKSTPACSMVFKYTPFSSLQSICVHVEALSFICRLCARVRRLTNCVSGCPWLWVDLW